MKTTIQVDNLHTLHYETHGNESGETVLFVHGGPGLGTTDNDLRFFDLSRQHVVLFDQRGCGSSMPTGELTANTTQHLVDDIHKIVNQLGKKEVYLFGGSWGSTLSLLYAIHHPIMVKGLVLRGLFTATKEERMHFEYGGTKKKFPEAWDRFISLVPDRHHDDPSGYYFNQILSGDTQARDRYAYELTRYGYAVSSIHASTGSIDDKIKQTKYLSKAEILAHYSKNNFFLPDDYILNNMNKIAHIPIKIIHGIYDEITLFSSVERFSNRFENIELIPVESGHSANDEEMQNGLTQAVQDFVK